MTSFPPRGEDHLIAVAVFIYLFILKYILFYFVLIILFYFAAYCIDTHCIL